MKGKSFIDIYFSASPMFRKIVDIGEWFIIILIGFLFPSPKISFFPLTHIIGVILLITGIWVHKLSHQANPQAHRKKEKVEKLVTTDIYSKIRHPIYIAYIICYFGTFFLFGYLSMLLPIIVFTYIFYHAAIKEERFLLEKFGEEYEEYMKKVRWRFIPKVF